MAEDELELLKRRKKLELQRRVLKQKQEQGQQQAAKEEVKKPSTKELLDRFFGDRAWEIYNAAWAQYPSVMPQVEKLLVDAISSGKVKQRIDGEDLYLFFREIGVPVRLQTTIRFKEHGELKTLTQKMKEDKSK